jgi:23S rRNA (cytosine1962-C5)-methyltransferase
VLLLDDDLLVVDKPEGVSTHAADPDRPDDCVSRLRVFLSRREGIPLDAVRLGIHQRLDRDTSGVLVFSRSRAGRLALARAFEGREARKRYLAVTDPSPRGASGTLTHDILEGRDGRMEAHPAGRGGPRSQRAVTRWEVLRREGPRALLALEPETGRTHQLRVQCAREGFPLLGDAWYGGAVAGRLHLHAEVLTFPGPRDGALVTFRAPEPACFAAALAGREGLRGELREALERAADARWALASDPETTAFRLCHDGDWAGLRVDVYARHAVLHGYDLSPEDEARALDAVHGLGFEGVYVKRRPRHASVVGDPRDARYSPRGALRGADAPEEFPVLEAGLRYLVRLGDGLSTGLFLDQRDNRRRVRALASGRTVLNLFAYTCGFTVAAAAGGARRTLSVDVSPAALAWGRRNLEANDLAGEAHTLTAADVFAWVEAARVRRDRFGLVVLDPPSYATTHGSRFSADGGYRALAAKVLALAEPGAKLLCCTNHQQVNRPKLRRWLHEAARDAGVALAQMKDLEAPFDHPSEPGRQPQLKSLLLTVAPQ